MKTVSLVLQLKKVWYIIITIKDLEFYEIVKTKTFKTN